MDNMEERREARRATMKDYYEKNKESLLEYHKKYYQENKKTINKYQKKYYCENRQMVCARQKEWRSKNRTKCNENKKTYRLKLRIDVLTYYGMGTCSCVYCGETRFPCLSIDHINNDGAEHRRELGCGGWRIYQWLKSNNYPRGYQTLCMNCQFIKMFEFKELKRRRNDNG